MVRGELIIRVSTSSKVPALASGIKEMIEKNVPYNLKVLLDELEKLRKSLPKGKKRQKVLNTFVRRKLGLKYFNAFI